MSEINVALRMKFGTNDGAQEPIDAYDRWLGAAETLRNSSSGRVNDVAP